MFLGFCGLWLVASVIAAVQAPVDLTEPRSYWDIPHKAVVDSHVVGRVWRNNHLELLDEQIKRLQKIQGNGEMNCAEHWINEASFRAVQALMRAEDRSVWSKGALASFVPVIDNNIMQYFLYKKCEARKSAFGIRVHNLAMFLDAPDRDGINWLFNSNFSKSRVQENLRNLAYRLHQRHDIGMADDPVCSALRLLADAMDDEANIEDICAKKHKQVVITAYFMLDYFFARTDEGLSDILESYTLPELGRPAFVMYPTDMQKQWQEQLDTFFLGVPLVRALFGCKHLYSFIPTFGWLYGGAGHALAPLTFAFDEPSYWAIGIGAEESTIKLDFQKTPAGFAPVNGLPQRNDLLIWKRGACMGIVNGYNADGTISIFACSLRYEDFLYAEKVMGVAVCTLKVKFAMDKQSGKVVPIAPDYAPFPLDDFRILRSVSTV